MYLMADFGTGPEVVRWWRPAAVIATLRGAAFLSRPGSEVSRVLAIEHPRWLVEAESADAARAIIADSLDPERHCFREQSERIPGLCDSCGHTAAKHKGCDCAAPGRILDSGGGACKERPRPSDTPLVNWWECTCYHDCGHCTKSGRWHQHDDEPCPIHSELDSGGAS